MDLINTIINIERLINKETIRYIKIHFIKYALSRWKIKMGYRLMFEVYKLKPCKQGLRFI